jgi:hypothetical protein
MQEVQFLLQNAHDRSLINRVRVGGFVNMYPNKETIDSNQVPDVEKRLEQRQQAARILLDVAKPTQEAERLFRSRIVEIIRDKLAGTSFVLEDQVPKEVRLAAIPAEKKDSLISFKTLVSKLPNIMSLPGADGVSLLNKVDGSFEVMRERSILKLVNLDNARVRVVIVKDGIETRIGTAWNDDAMILATRFASGRDLGISKGQQPANREYYIPTKDFLANNE